MITMSFTDEEVQMLQEMLQACITDIRGEISATDNYDYKDMLKRREELLKKMFASLQESQPVAG